MPAKKGRSIGDYLSLVTLLVVVAIFGFVIWGMLDWYLHPQGVTVVSVINLFFQPLKTLSYIGYVVAIVYSVKDTMKSLRTHMEVGRRLIYILFIFGSLSLLYMEHDDILGYQPVTAANNYSPQNVKGYSQVLLRLNPPTPLFILFSFMGYAALVFSAYEYYAGHRRSAGPAAAYQRHPARNGRIGRAGV